MDSVGGYWLFCLAPGADEGQSRMSAKMHGAGRIPYSAGVPTIARKDLFPVSHLVHLGLYLYRGSYQLLYWPAASSLLNSFVVFFY